MAPGPVVIRTVTTVGRFLSRVSYLPSYVFLQRRRSFTSGKLYACLQKFLCFLQVSDRAYVSGARCIGSSFHRSGTTVFKCSSLHASLLTVLLVVYSCFEKGCPTPETVRDDAKGT